VAAYKARLRTKSLRKLDGRQRLVSLAGC
jgi:hypothetical protein